MVWYSFPFLIPKIHQPIFKSSLLSTSNHLCIFKSSLQKLNFSLPFCQLYSSRALRNPDNLNKNPNIFSRKDWLSPSEVIKIFENLNDPTLTLPLFTQISERKDYKPNEALYMTVINKLALGNDFDGIEAIMHKIKSERKCRLSDEFFRNVIKIYGHSAGRINRAIETLFDMPNYKSWPSVKTFNFVLNLLVSTKQFDVVHEVYMGASKLGVEIDACCLNIIIKGLCGCGQMEAAVSVLDEFPKQKCRPTVRTFSTIMHGFCECGGVDEAFNLLERMEKEGVEPDPIVFNILISGLRKQGKVERGIVLFDRMMLKGCDPNSGTYQEVLYCLLDAKKFVEAKDFMKNMTHKGIIPSFESHKLMIHGCCSENLVKDLDWALWQMVRHGFVPKMGMWKRVLHCVLLDSHIANSDHFSYEEIIK